MEELFVPFKLAVKLKDIGFDERCVAYFWRDKFYTTDSTNGVGKVSRGYESIPATITPTWSQVFDWFRIKHNIVSYVMPMWLLKDDGLWCYEITNFKNNWDEDIDLRSCEEAKLKCLEKLIEIVANKK